MVPHAGDRLRAATVEDGPSLLRLWGVLFNDEDVAASWRRHAQTWFERMVGDSPAAHFPLVESGGAVVATAVATLDSGVPNPYCPRGRTVRLADRVDLSATPEGQRVYEKAGFVRTSAPRMKLVLPLR